MSQRTIRRVLGGLGAASAVLILVALVLPSVELAGVAAIIEAFTLIGFGAFVEMDPPTRRPPQPVRRALRETRALRGGPWTFARLLRGWSAPERGEFLADSRPAPVEDVPDLPAPRDGTDH